MSDTTGTEETGESDARDAERQDPSIAGKPEIGAFGDEAASVGEEQPGRLDEREQRQHAVQQHGDTFAVDSAQPTDTSGVPRRAPTKATALPGDEAAEDAPNAREDDAPG